MKVITQAANLWDSKVVVIAKFVCLWTAYVLLASEYGAPVITSLVEMGAGQHEMVVVVVGLFIPLAEISVYYSRILSEDSDHE